MIHFIKKVYAKLRFLYYKKRKPKNEDEFYKFFYTINPGWNKPEPNEDESLRWAEIQKAISSLNIVLEKASILEIGCGRGWLCNKLNKLGAITIGIDPVEPVIKYAAKIFPNLEFYAAITPTFIQKFPKKQFDIIVTTEVIEHVLDKTAFLKDINTLLKPGGTLILTTPRLEHFDDFIAIYGEDTKQPVEEWLSENQIKDLFEAHEFTIQYKNFFSPLPHPSQVMNIYQIWVCRKK